jgi:hypothetical protein
VPIVEIEHDGIRCGLCPAMLTFDSGCADHRLELLHLGVADDLDHCRRRLHLR